MQMNEKLQIFELYMQIESIYNIFPSENIID